MKAFSFLFFGSLALALTACQKKDSTDPSAVALSMKAINTTSVFARTQSPNLQWSSITAAVNLLKIEAKSGSTELEFRSNANQTIDLLNTASPLGNITLPAGTYGEVEFKALLNPSASAPALLMRGQLTDANGTLPITFQANEALEIKGEKRNVTITAGTVHQASIAVDLSKVMQGITVADLTAASRTNGMLVISSNTNSSLYSRIVRNLRNLEDECEFH